VSLTATVSSARERECIMSDPDLLDITFGFGTSLEGRSPVCMLNEHDVIYSLGKKIVLHNLNKNMQMVLPMTPRTKSISAFEACSRKRYLAVCEIPATPSEPPQVSILDLESSPVKRLRTLLNVTDDGELAQTGTAYLDVGFSADSKLVVAICNEPKYTIVVWEWFRTRRVGAYDIRTQVSRVRFNPFDAAQVSTSGNNHLRLWKVQENVLKAYPAFQGLPTGLNITDHSWTQDDRMVAISDRADVFVIDEGIIVQEISNIHPNCANEKLASSFTSVVISTRGIVVAGSDGSIVLIDMVAEKSKLDGRDPFKVVLKAKARKKIGPNDIMSTSLSPKGDFLMCVFKDNFGSIALGDTYLTADGQDKSLALTSVIDINVNYPFRGLHSGAITDMDCAVRKPFVVTCSRDDQSVRLWNFRTMTSVAAQTFSSESQRPMSVSMDPSGSIILVCFSGRLQIFLVHINGLKMQREIICRGARKAYFSHGSGLFVVACGKRLEIYHTYTGRHLGSFQGHAMPIQSVRWRTDDLGFISCGLDGAIYQWRLEAIGTNTRSSEHHAGMNGFQFDVVACGNHGSIVAAGCILPSNNAHPSKKQKPTDDRRNKGPAFGRGQYGSKQEDTGSAKQSDIRPANTIIRGWKQRPEGPGCTVDMPGRVMTIIIHAHLVYFGLDTGMVLVHEWPLEGGQIVGKFPIHKSSIVSMSISADGQFLFVGGEGGVFIMMSILQPSMDGHILEDSKFEPVNFKRVYLDEKLLITDADEVQSKLDEINDLQLSLSEIEGGHRVSIELMKSAHAETVAKMKAEHKIQIRAAEEQEEHLRKLLKSQKLESSAVLSKKEETHMKTAKMLETLYERKLSIETAKVDSLNADLRDALIDKSDLEMKLRLEISELKQTYEARIEKLEAKSKREKKQQDEYAAYIKNRYEEVRDKSESAQDKELAELNLSFQRERKTFAEKEEVYKGEMIILKKSVSMIKEALDHEEERSRRNEEGKALAISQVGELEKIIQKQKSKIESLNEDCKVRDKQIKIHMRKVGELERVRHVLQHQLHEANGELEPMDREVEAMRGKIAELNEEYKTGMRTAGVVQQRAEEGQRKLRTQKAVIRKHEAEIIALKTQIASFSRDVEKLVASTEPAQWPEKVLELYEKYVVQIGERGGKNGPDKNTVEEFNRQRKFMERTVTALKREKTKANQSILDARKKSIVENASLMRDLNEARHDARHAQREVEALKSELLGIKTRNDLKRRMTDYKRNKNRDSRAPSASSTRRPGTANDRPNTTESIISDNGSTYNHDDYGGFADEIRKSFENAISLDDTNAAIPGMVRPSSPDSGDENLSSRENNLMNALGQLKSKPGGSRVFPRPASSVMLRTQARPKSGGRPLTASERHRMLHSNTGLAKSMSGIQKVRVLGSPEKLLLELETSEMQNLAQGLQIDRLNQQLSHSLKRTQRLENSFMSNSAARLEVGGRVRPAKKGRPKSVHGGRKDVVQENESNDRRPGSSPGQSRIRSTAAKNKQQRPKSGLKMSLSVGGQHK
jgi:cilia- and flagella-associated protein 57